MPSQQAPEPIPTDRSPQTNKPSSSRKAILLIGLLLVLLASIGIGYYFTSKNNDSDPIPERPTVTTEFPKPKPVTYEETVSPNAYGQFMSVALEIFWSGGNANGQEIQGHGYYPSVADVKNANWAKKNLKLHAELNKSIKDGSVVYVPKGCDADKPSSSQNKCTSFVIQSNGQDIAKSNH